MAVAALTAFFVVGAGAIGGTVVSGSPSGFESGDGNMVLDNTDGNHTDWNCFEGSDGFQSGTPDSHCKVTTGATVVPTDPNGELEFAGGAKFDDICPGTTTKVSNPPKDEFLAVTSFSDVASSGDTYFYGSTIRATNNGDSSGDVELHQGAGTATTFACRQAGDRLIAYDFTGGGTSLSFNVLTYITSANPTAGGNIGLCESGKILAPANDACWGKHVVDLTAGTFNGGVNTLGQINAADNGITGKDVPQFDFAEFGVNLSQALGLSGKCLSFPQQAWESRTSGEAFGSQPKDLELGSQRVSNCGKLVIKKVTVPSPDTTSTSFPFRVDGSNPPNTNLPKTFSLSNGGSNTTTVFAGTDYSAKESVPPNWALTDAMCDNGAGNFTAPALPVSGGNDGTITAIHVAADQTVTCTFTDTLQKGAIQVTKTGKDLNCVSASTTISNGTCTATLHIAALSGAQFTYALVTGGVQGTPVNFPTTTDSHGHACVENVAFGTYRIAETGAPPHYAKDTGTQDVMVNTNATCSSNSGIATPTNAFVDHPLTDVTVTAAAQIPGATQSTISTCSGPTGTSGPSGPTGPGDPVSASVTGAVPGNNYTYTCTVSIDP